MKNNRTTKRELIEFSVGVICIYLFVGYIARLFTVPTGSMAPMVNAGDLIVANTLAYMMEEPQRGDVIVFKGDDKKLLKRIIGLPNDTISFADGKVVINGEVLEEDYIPKDVFTFSPKTFVVPEGHYFVLGDSRYNSVDSRYFEQPYIESSRIIAKVNYVIPVSEYTDVFCAEEYKKNSEKSVLSSVITTLMNRQNSKTSVNL